MTEWRYNGCIVELEEYQRLECALCHYQDYDGDEIEDGVYVVPITALKN